MSNLAGTWRFTQHWEGAPPYSFNAEFTAEGTISIQAGAFFGTYRVLGNSNQIALAIADFGKKSITAYVGNVVGGAMGGQATGAQLGGKPSNGNWSAQRIEFAQAETKDHHVPN
ncbi:MAG: hypothetical protein AAGA77_19620 [Bacteroidota bacterium]